MRKKLVLVALVSSCVLAVVGVAIAQYVSNSASRAPTAVVSASRSSWPSSYFSGPLGNNEVLPAVKGHQLLMLWSGVAAQGYTATGERQFMAKRISDMGRNPDLIGFQCPGNPSPGSCGFDVSSTDLAENWIHSLGAIPFVSWAPDGSSAQIAAGSEDSEIDAAAARFKAFGHRIMVRMFQEFNGNGAGTWSDSDFVNAWRHVVRRNIAPQLGPEACNEIDAADGSSRLAY